MFLRSLTLAVAVLLNALAVFLVVGNAQPLTVSLLGQPLTVPAFALILCGLSGGWAAGAAVFLSTLKSVHSQKQKIEQWEVQDAKLIAEIKSDRERQLEAKIATLESALKNALKKG